MDSVFRWKGIVPRPLKELRWRLRDELDVLLGKRGRFDPPARFGFPGHGDYREIGRQFFELFRRLGGLESRHRVLEIGCGTGRMALPLAGFLSAGGRYEGVDVSAPSIRWCRSAISRRFPDFRFQHADVLNREYNPGGSVRAVDYRLPFADRDFDFVFLTSVFTHMLPEEIRHYLAEAARVLAPGGTLFATFFLIPESPPAAPQMRFDHAGPGFRTVNPQVPEQAIAVSEADVRLWLGQAALAIAEPVHRGGWPGIPGALTFQDIVIARKARESA